MTDADHDLGQSDGPGVCWRFLYSRPVSKANGVLRPRTRGYCPGWGTVEG
jgi:hypothetical protein